MRLRARDRDVGFALYARTHRAPAMAVGIVTTLLVQVLVGMQRIQLPNSEVVFPYRKLLPIGLALSVLFLVTTDVREMEYLAGRTIRRLTRRMVIASAVVTIGLEVVQAWMLTSLDEGIACARAFLVWTFLGLVAGALGSLRGVWLLPVVTVVPLTYLDPFRDGHAAWWNFPLTPASSPGGWVFAGVLAAALLAISRLQQTRGFRRRILPLV